MVLNCYCAITFWGFLYIYDHICIWISLCLSPSWAVLGLRTAARSHHLMPHRLMEKTRRAVVMSLGILPKHAPAMPWQRSHSCWLTVNPIKSPYFCRLSPVLVGQLVAFVWCIAQFCCWTHHISCLNQVDSLFCLVKSCEINFFQRFITSTCFVEAWDSSRGARAIWMTWWTPRVPAMPERSALSQRCRRASPGDRCRSLLEGRGFWWWFVGFTSPI